MENEKPTAKAEADGLPSVKQQLAECQQWATWFALAGYGVEHGFTDERGPVPYGFDQQWVVWSPDGRVHVGSFDIDGCGASWHGPDDTWLGVIGPHVDMLP
ncbi:MAG TPA: hypothetical protein VF477_19310 [Mycobacterium sp.]